MKFSFQLTTNKLTDFIPFILNRKPELYSVPFPYVCNYSTIQRIATEILRSVPNQDV